MRGLDTTPWLGGVVFGREDGREVNVGTGYELSRFRPVFVLAPARSCSSLVVAMLGQHPELYGLPELRLFRATRVGHLLINPPPGDGIPAKERLAGLVRALAELHEGCQSADAVTRAWQWLEHRADQDAPSVFEHIQELIAPLVAVEKSPETSLSDEALSRCAERYPQARYIHLVRHPWSTVASMKTAWEPREYWRVPRDAAAQFCADLWLKQHSRIAAFGARLGSSRFIQLSAEEIANQPGRVFPPLCRWLGIDDNTASVAAMCHPEHSLYAAPGPGNATGGYDPKFLHAPHLHPVALPGSMQVPASWKLDRWTYAAVVDLARTFGYRDSEAGSPRLMRYRWGGLTRRHA